MRADRLKPAGPLQRLTGQQDPGAGLEVEADVQLVRRCLAGDQAACALLVSRHARVAGTVIWRAVRNRELVEDLCQEAFLRVFRGLSGFDGRARLSTWICSIAHRVAVDELRRQGRSPRIVAGDTDEEDVDTGVAEMADDASADPLQQVIAIQEAGQVQAALDALPDRYRLPLAYVAVQELGYDEVAMMLGIPTGTVKTLVFRGKALLRERLLAAAGGAVGPVTLEKP
jgi:RNA polymerase sigma-70 factor (ECF subfamily)